jgi:uroporphyrinogen-III synthase
MSNIYLLSDKNMEDVINLPMIQISPIKQNIDLQNFDALIFTSKNAIPSINIFDTSWKAIPSYAIAKQTAKVIESLNGNLVFTGESGHGDDFAKELIPQLKNKKALYIRGAKVVSNLVQILKENKINCDELIVYETKCKEYTKKYKPEKNSIIIFSSPSTIECFFKNFDWDSSYKAVSIGKTTAKYLPKNITTYIANTTSLDSCIKLAKSLI